MTSHAEDSDHETIRASDVRFFWVDGEGKAEDGSYHWMADCPWVTIALWYGGHLVTSEAPPPGATDAAYWREELEKRLQGPAWDPGVVDSPPDEPKPDWWLCNVCSQYFPKAEAEPRSAEEEPCEKCGCGRELHARLRGPFDHGCGMFWLDVFERDENGEVLASGLIHCPCDGYAPPPDGRPLTSSELLAYPWWSGGRRDVSVVVRSTSPGASPGAGDSG
jgi:hypothetical protein